MLASAAVAPLADPAVVYPDWYLRRIHQLPCGYLSRRSAILYSRLVEPLYNARMQRYVSDDVARSVLSASPGSVLDVGCGTGGLLRSLVSSASAVDLVGIDLSPYMIEEAVRAVPSAAFVHAEASELQLEQQFDAVVGLHVFGHMPRSWAFRALQRAADHLSADGLLHVVGHSWHAIPIPPTLREEAGRARSLLGGVLTHRAFRHAIE